MQVNVEEISPVEKRLSVEIEWPIVAAKMDAAYKELGRDVALRGFRKGKVPRAMLEKMFARQVENEVVEQLVRDGFVAALHQHDLHPVAEPAVESVDWNKGTPFRFLARIEVRAPFEPTAYEGVELERPKPTVTVEEIDQALENKRQAFAEFRKIEGRETLGPSDAVILEAHGEVNGQPYKTESLLVELAARGTDREPLPGLAEALLGKPVNAAALPVELPPPPGAAEDAKPAKLTLTVKDAREKLIPNLDDDFAKDTGEADTLDELRGKLREQLLAGKEGEVARQLKDELVKEILRRNPFQVAPSLVDRQAQTMIQRARLGMALQGIDVRNVKLDEAKLRDRFRPEATEEVRATFLIDAIATKEKVEVSDGEMEKRLTEMARSRDQSVARLKAELQKEGRLAGIRDQLRGEKTLDLLLAKAIIKPASTEPTTEK